MGRADWLALGQLLVAYPATLCFFCLTPAAASLAGCADDNTGADTLFTDRSAPLDTADRQAIAAIIDSMFPLSSDGRHFVHPDCGDVMPVTEIVDLNGDQVHEVFVSWGNSCTSGGAGRSLTLFSKNAAGDYQMQFGFPALGWTALASRNQGWPDLSFGGPGFCHGVWTWSDDSYAFRCNLAETESGCESRGNVC